MENKKARAMTTSKNGKRPITDIDQPSELMRLFEARLKSVQLNGKASNRATSQQIKNEVPQALIDALIYRLAETEN